MADNYYFTGGFLLAEVVEIGRRRTEQTHPLLLFPVFRHLINFRINLNLKIKKER